MTPLSVAQWMLSELERNGVLHQDTAAPDIDSIFGPDFIYLKENGNPAIRKDVLNAFAKLTGNQVVWERGERLWRKREPFDNEGRLQP
jgi:hypothetical protein